MKHIILALTKNFSRKVIPALLVLLAIMAAPVPVRADTFTTLQSFDGTNGALSNAPPTQVTNGDLYGTTFQGGVDVANAFGGSGCGTLFNYEERAGESSVFGSSSSANSTTLSAKRK